LSNKGQARFPPPSCDRPAKRTLEWGRPQFPVCHEQHRIVSKVDELLALVDCLKAALAESRSRQARLSATLMNPPSPLPDPGAVLPVQDARESGH